MNPNQKPLLKPLIIDARFLRPLPKALFRSACSECDRRQAMWEMGPADQDHEIVCSVCFLYESKWGEDRVAEILDLTNEMEREVGEKWLRDERGKLLSVKDCDRVLGAIALTSRMFAVRDQMESMSALTKKED
jgi:hypothetical protein